ncbi:MAG: ATP-binding protein [Acutalibacteraceae bacterium]
MFENIKATEAFKNSISTALKSGKLSHALILQGSDENSRLTAAKEIAAYILCHSDNKPCGECKACRKTFTDIHPDVHLLKKAAGDTMIKVDSIRELKKKALVLPNDGDKSIFIIENAEEMNPQAQNALLKIFEEPAKHLLFILCCNSKSSLLETIISRATSYTLGETKSEDINEDELKAVSLANELVITLVQDNELEFLKKISVFQKDKLLFKNTVEKMQIIVRDAFILQSGGKNLLCKNSETAVKLQKSFTQKSVIEIYNCLQSFIDGLKLNPNYNLTLTRFSAMLYSLKSK